MTLQEIFSEFQKYSSYLYGTPSKIESEFAAVKMEPDLTAMGKVIGAGLPIGIVGGKKEIMMKAAPIMGADVFDMSSSQKSSSQDVLFHSGTYNGHPLILKLGLKTLEILETEQKNIIKNTNALKDFIKEFYASHGIHVTLPGLGTMFNVAITDLDEIKNYRDMQTCDFELRKKMDYSLMLEGVYNKPCNRYNFSTAHTSDVIDFTMEAYKKAFKRI